MEITRRARGAAAVEFALVLPWFLMVLAAMFSIGRGFWTEFVLLDIASATTRSCLASQPPPAAIPGDSSGYMTGCATADVSTLTSQFTNLCPGSQVLSGVKTYPVPQAFETANASNTIRMLEVTLTCNMPFILAKPGTSASYPIAARSSIPYLN